VKKEERMKKIIVIAALGSTFMSVRCSNYVENYSIMEYLPYNNYGNYFTPDPIDTTPVFALAGGYSNTQVTADGGVDIGRSGPFGALRFSVIPRIETGLTASTRNDGEDFSPFFLIDGRGNLMNEPACLGVDLGFGFGPGERNMMYDFRGSFIAGMPLFEGRINPYVAPRIMAMSYVWQRVYHDDQLNWDSYYATALIYGASAGVSFSLPVGSYIMKFVPEITWMGGKEPQLARVDYTALQIGAKLMFVFRTNKPEDPEIRIRPCLF
jgi:hypothetical protein